LIGAWRVAACTIGANSDGSITPATLEPSPHFWIALDCDRIPCPDNINPLSEPDRAVEHVVSALPVEFHGATCWWQFTAGQGFKPGISVRLFFWADRSVADWELEMWLTGAPVDPAIFKSAQPIYVAWPIFEGGPDPVPIRSGVRHGARATVTPPEIAPQAAAAPKITGKRPPTYTRSSDVSKLADYSGSGYEFHRARIGDHVGGDGFHRPVKASVASWIAAHGSTADTEWLRQDLECAIKGAPRDLKRHDDAYVGFRISDLDTLIPAIIDLQRKKEASRPQFIECEPTYPPPMGSVEEARALLARVCDEHVKSIVVNAEAMATYKADLRTRKSRQAA
jgi:hypothetical protein